MLHLILGPAGTGKTHWVRQRMAELVKSGEKNLALLVPEQNTFESERAVLRLLESASTDIVEVTGFTRLADAVEQRGGHCAREAASDGVKAFLMGRAVRAVKSELTAYSRGCESPEFCRSVVELTEELKRSCIGVDDLRVAAEKAGGALTAKVQDLARIIGTYQALLDSRFRDPLDDLDRLYASLGELPYFADRIVFVDAFKGFTEQQFLVLERILVQSKELYLTLCTDSLQDHEKGLGLFSNVKRTAARLIESARSHGVAVASPRMLTENHRFLDPSLAQLEGLLRGVEPGNETSGEAITVFSCANAYDEADTVARTIRRLVRTEGYRYRDFAVIARDMERYHVLFVNACERYAVPCFNDRRVPADSLALMRFVLQALACVVNGYQAESVLPLVKSVLSPLTVEEASELDNYALVWNKHGRDWLTDWTENPNGLEETFDEAALVRINGNRRTVIEPLQKLDAALADGKAKSVCYAIYRMLIDLKIDRRLADYARRLDETGDSYFADLHRQSWDVMMECLDNTVRAMGDEACDKEEFLSLFTMLLSACDLGSIPDRLDEVVVGSADRIRLGAARIVFVIGANYGVFPRIDKPSGLLSQNDRRRLIGGGLAMPDYARENAVDEQFMAYTALTGASRALYITYAAASLAGEETAPSEFVRRILKGMPGVRVVRSRDTAEDAYEGVLPALERVSGREGRRFAASLLRQLRERKDPRGDLLQGLLTPAAPERLTPETAKTLFGSELVLSASRLEEYNKCPFLYFCRNGLKAKPLVSAKLDSLHSGTLLHFVYEQAVRRHGASLADLSPEERQALIREWIREYSDRAFGGYDRLDRSFLFLLDQIALILEEALSRLADDLGQTRFKPDRCEMKIGPDQEVTARLPLREGSITLVGSIDRVDVYQADGKTYVRIIDYKSGKKTFDVSELFYGLNMQMLLYLFSVTESGCYENARPAGVLYFRSYRDAATDEEAGKTKDFPMNGLLLDDPCSLEAMEPDGEGHHVPYAVGSAKSSVASPEAFEAIRSYVRRTLISTGNRLLEGDIAADPLPVRYGESRLCDGCDYRSACRRADCYERDMEKISLKNALEKLEGEVEPNGL